MRIESIGLAWFRGAADFVALDAGSKSVVVYGENGSGKSSFVDAVEYVLNGRRIGHLAHEYSGKQQEKAIINTHITKGKNADFQIKFADGSELHVTIHRNGTSTSSGAEVIGMDAWDYRRTVLRQDEIADFIRQTKGNKYSALLPLLGLDSMEVAAENLRQLAKAVEQDANLSETSFKLGELRTKYTTVFGAVTDTQIAEKIESLHAAYCENKKTTTDPMARFEDLQAELSTRIARFSADQKKHLTLLAIAGLDLKGHIADVRTANGRLAGAVEPLVGEKLEVLEVADLFAGKLRDEKLVECPACGQSIAVEDFRAHVEAEKERLHTIIDTFNSRKTAIGILCDTIKSLRSNFGKPDIKSWRDDPIEGVIADNFKYLDGLKVEAFRVSCSEDELKKVEDNLFPLWAAATAAAQNAPPDVQTLTADKRSVEACSASFEATALAQSVTRARALASFLSTLEQGVRGEIRLQSNTVVAAISSDIQRMWRILHPGEAIEDVRLNAPAGTDKAIDIALKFFGVEQDSPRLTLSEGYRNSLGLCIFLAMTKREAEKDRPLFLDDVVVSFDRNHRGMIVELLEKEFSGRQVLILTHDRDWYVDLRQRLDGGSWMFKALMPYESPKMGIRWSAKTYGFDDARAQLKDSPDSAGNTVRKIMEIELATLGERLKLRLPYLHRERNDHRVAHDFLYQMISDGPRCFQKKRSTEYEPYAEAMGAFREADMLLVSWGNKSSHTLDIVRTEAGKLISVCERALEFFYCQNCGKPVYKLNDQSAELVQCQCSHLRWRYGKG